SWYPQIAFSLCPFPTPVKPFSRGILRRERALSPQVFDGEIADADLLAAARDVAFEPAGAARQADSAEDHFRRAGPNGLLQRQAAKLEIGRHRLIGFIQPRGDGVAPRPCDVYFPMADAARCPAGVRPAPVLARQAHRVLLRRAEPYARHGFLRI